MLSLSKIAAALVALTLATACDDDDTGGSCPRVGNLETGEPLEDAKFIIEHNATDADTGFQVAVDGEPWDLLEVVGPNGGLFLTVQAREGLQRGLTELFFETSEPENAEVPIAELLAEFPEGEYEFTARSAEDATAMQGTATLAHAIPAGPVIVSPAAGAVVNPASLVVSWQAVTETISGELVSIAGYQLIVEIDTDGRPAGFSNPVLSVTVGPSVTSVTVPPEFFTAATQYKLEVLALATNGNQTLSSSSFSTQ